jgi:CDGSH-type Zn-finger protein
MPVTIKVRQNGPLAVDLTTGEIELIDHEGNRIPLPEGKTTIALCRCGASTRKPFCDGTHSRIGFQGAIAAREQHDAQVKAAEANAAGANSAGAGSEKKGDAATG